MVDAPAPTAATRLRLWPVPVILSCAAAAFGGALWVQSHYEEVQSGVPWVVIFATGGLTFLALMAWLLLFSRMRALPKWILFALAIASIVVFVAVFKIGYVGRLRPFVETRDWVQRLWPRQPAERMGSADLTATTPHDRPEFLGTKRRPVFPSLQLDTDWKSHPPKQVWRHPIGKGFASYAVVGDFALTQQQDGDEELVVCYRWRTGQKVWQHAYKASFSSTLGGDGPRATPTVDAGRVYTMGATGILHCLDGRDGKVLWQADTLKENLAKNHDWGVSCSPLVVDNLVVVSAGLRDHSIATRPQPHYALIAYDKMTGKPVWRAGTDDASYSSPSIENLGGVRQIVMVNAGSVTGHEPASGEVLWEFAIPRDMPTVSQAVILDNERVFFSKGYGAGCGVRRVTRDDKGKWSVADDWSKSTVMRTKFTNVVVHGGHVYGLDDGFLECIDLADGRLRWTNRREHKGNFEHGQVLLVGDVLLVQAEQGDVALVEPTPKKYHELARFSPLSGRTWNYPVLIDNILLLRNDREAACYELKRK